MSIIIDGKALSVKILEQLKERVNKLSSAPILSVIQVGNDPASNIYIRNKEKACKEVGILCFVAKLDEHISQKNLENFVDQCKADGIMLQLPLPKHLNATKVMERIYYKSDVDGLHPLNSGFLFQNREGFVPCTPKGIIRMLKEYNIPLAGRHAVVVGRSNIVGKPISMLLLNENCTVTICHSHTANLAEITKQADILISAVGKPHLITADMVKQYTGTAIIDVGINRIDGKLVGDVDFDNVKDVVGWITPVPGGVGPMTIAMLLENTVEAAERNIKCS